jgi:hypothetical protein
VDRSQSFKNVSLDEVSRRPDAVAVEVEGKSEAAVIN